MTDTILRAAAEARVKQVLLQFFDTGNCLPEAIDNLMLKEDAYEIMNAIMGQPESVEQDHALVLKDMDYYWKRLRDLFVDQMVQEIDYQLQEHTGRARAG